MNQEESKLLYRIDERTAQMAKQLETQASTLRDHVEKDERDIGWLQKIAFGGVGAYVLVQLIGVFHK